MSRKPAQRKVRKRVRKKARRKNPFKRGFWVRHWREGVIILVASIALYAMSIPFEFVLDDQMVISDNAFTKRGIEGIDDIFANDSFTGYFGEQKDLVAGARYRPLSIATFALEFEVGGLDPSIYHVMNILFYGILCLLLFRVVSIFFHDHKPRYWFFAIPFIAALFFTVHPIHTEVVANVKGRDEILALLLSLASVYAVMRYIFRGSGWWLAASSVFFFAGLMAKENTMTFLAVIPLSVYFFSRRNIGQALVATLPAVVAAVVYLLIRVAVIGFLFSETETRDLLNNPFLEMTAVERYATIMYTLGMYVKLLFVPHPLTHDYYPYHIPMMHWGKPLVILSALVYLALGVLAIWGFRKKRVISYCILYFFATLSIVSNVFFPVGTFMNERFLFMPSVAFCIAIAYLAFRGYRGLQKLPWLIPACTALYLLAFVAKSATRIPAWRNPLTLNTAGVAVSENSARANCFMGTALYQKAREIQDREKRLEIVKEADAYINKSLSIIPDYLSANQMKSGIIAEYYRYDRDLDKLLNGFAEILERKPNVQYIQEYSEYLNGRVDQQKLLDFYFRVGHEIMTRKVRRYDYAVLYLNYGLQLDPDNPRINWAMGRALKAWGDSRADTYLNKAYRLDPSLRGRE